MIEQIVDISESGADLSVRHAQLCVSRDGAEKRLPLCEVAVLVGAHPAIRYSQAVLAGLMEHNGALIVCGSDRKPAGLLLPLAGHHLHTERLRRQIDASLPCRKRLWQQIVQAKIAAQAQCLERLHGKDFSVGALATKVRSGDSANHEAQAARRYWQRLFPEQGFRRDPEGEGPNALLNYGYAVLRAIVARAIVGAGLHPAIGLHHHNRYNPYCLADDLMEPLRPTVDEAVYRHAEAEGVEVNPAAKRALIGALLGRFDLQGEQRSLFDCSARTAAALAAALAGEIKTLPLARPGDEGWTHGPKEKGFPTAAD